MKLNTENSNCFIYETEELLIELLGGVRIDTLDRMRVTIKVTVVNRKHKKYMNNEELAGLSVRHNLDLYNDNQVEKFIRTVAERLEVGSIALTKAIADITGELEVYRLTMLDRKNDKPVKQLTQQEWETAIQFLEQKNFNSPQGVPSKHNNNDCSPQTSPRRGTLRSTGLHRILMLIN
jgi:hypothetical protein